MRSLKVRGAAVPADQVLEPWSSTELSDVLEQIAHQTYLPAM
jgi:hypothetical protein